MKCEALANGIQNKVEYKQDALIEEWPHSWPAGEISYRLNNFTDDITKDYHQTRAVTAALPTWQQEIKDLKFRREYNKNTSVDFEVSFKPLENFTGPGVLAQAWFPGQGPISGDVEINDNWDWVTHALKGDIGHPPLVPILIHEFGHSLGLRHNVTQMDSIMYPSFNLGKKKNDLNDNDRERIQSRYGKRTLSQRIRDYFMRRRDAGYDFR